MSTKCSTVILYSRLSQLYLFWLFDKVYFWMVWEREVYLDFFGLYSPSCKQEGVSFLTPNSLLFVISAFTWIPRVIPFKEEEMSLPSLCANFCRHQLWKQPFSCCSRTNDLPPGTCKILLLPPWISACGWCACVWLLPAPASDPVSALPHGRSSPPVPRALSLWQLSPISMGVPLAAIRKPKQLLLWLHLVTPHVALASCRGWIWASFNKAPSSSWLPPQEPQAALRADLTDLTKVPASQRTG